MDLVINGRTPEEIKAALAFCTTGNVPGYGCNVSCPYLNTPNCWLPVKCDALELIKHLEAERDAALVKPLQKPLTLEEATGSEWSVWLEMKGWKYPQVCDVWISEKLDGYAMVALVGRSKRAHVALERYGEGWRCWAERPTEEERKASTWRNENE